MNVGFLDQNGEISKELLNIVENAEDLVFVKNTRFEYVAVSRPFAQKCMGAKVEDVLGHTDFELFADQSRAQKYRDEDGKLLASNQEMMEFAENYVSMNGDSYPCCTAKYLIRDRDGKVTALLGQYHELDLRMRREVEQEFTLNHRASMALNRPFFVSNYVDLKNNSFTTLWAMDYVADMMKGCTTAQEGFDRFFSSLVCEDHVERVKDFCAMDTLPKRLKGKNQIVCEYLSKVALGWCRISFYPCEYDEHHEVSHVLFTVAPVDEEQARIIDEGHKSHRDLETIFDEVPGGIVLYRYDEQGLHVLKMSRYYQELYGYSMVNDSGIPDFQRIHPDDLPAYQEAIQKALLETHTLEYVFRVWNPKRGRYGWTQINAIAKPQEDKSLLVYALYTDVTDRKIAELRLLKSRASILAALGAAEQYSYEYDPVQHTSTCFTNELNDYHTNPVIVDYPQCFRKGGFIHPDDVELFISTVAQIDEGADSAHCTIRACKKGKYHWHSCTFDAFFDSEKGYRVALLTVVDVTDRVHAKQNYEDRIQSLLKGEKNMLCMGTFNLMQNTFELVHCEEGVRAFLPHTSSFDDARAAIASRVVDIQGQKLVEKEFARSFLLQQVKQSRMHVQMEVLIRFSAERYEWVDLVLDLVKNPLTDEIAGVALLRSAQKAHMEQELLSVTLKKDYVFAAIVFKDTDEFYIYNAKGENFKTRMEHFWDHLPYVKPGMASPEAIEYLTESLKKERMLKLLDQQEEFSYVFDSRYSGGMGRMEVKFRYLDAQKTSLIVTVREITDQSLLQQMKYESEHDVLTGLLNRKTGFEESRRLLEKNPDTQYVLVHFDVRHFHLYNTFFGEEEGDRLLQRIAEVFNSMAKDYDEFICGRIESDVFYAFFPLNRVVFETHVRRCYREAESFSPDFPLELLIGAYLVEDASMSMEAMFSRATIAAKSGVKNLFGLISRYDETMENELIQTQRITSEMVSALEKEQFEMYLQPKVSLKNGEVIGAEALVRWNHPVRGMISPGVFIPVFEKNGFITRLDRYMWERACKLLSAWKKEGKPVLPISVNLSRVSMYSHATVPFLKSLVQKYDLEPELLELELTETAYMDDPEDLKRMLKELRSFGFKILMDDFGSGYSSLNTLRELPVDILKLDMKFLSESMHDIRGNAVLSAIMRMSDALNLPIVAEGVEDREQADVLRDLGCTYAQGYLFARPMPVIKYEEYLKEQSTEMMQCEKKRMNMAGVQPDTLFGLLEYKKEHFAQIKISARFAQVMKAQSVGTTEQFVAHLGAKEKDLLCRAVDHCARTRGETMLFFDWDNEDGTYAKYQCLTTYTGSSGGVEQISLSPIEITYMNVFGSPPTTPMRMEVKNDVPDFVRSTAQIFDRLYLVHLNENTYTCIMKATDGTEEIMQSAASKDFFEKARGRFYNPLNKHLLDYLFNEEGLREILKDKDDYYVECKDKEQGDHIFGVMIVCAKRSEHDIEEVAFCIRDITDTKVFEHDARSTLLRDNERLKQLANRDALTGLYNRRGLMEYVSTEIHEDAKIAMLLVDVDEFKEVNDLHGHKAGDRLLIRVAALLKETFRSNDVFVRMGGDEFMVLLINCTKEQGKMIEAKIKSVNEKLAQPQGDVPIGSISVGVSFSREGESNELFERCDAALYHVKNNGRKNCCIFEEELTTE